MFVAARFFFFAAFIGGSQTQLLRGLVKLLCCVGRWSSKLMVAAVCLRHQIQSIKSHPLDCWLHISLWSLTLNEVYLSFAASYVVLFESPPGYPAALNLSRVKSRFWASPRIFGSAIYILHFETRLACNLLEGSPPVSPSQSHLQWINSQIWLKIYARNREKPDKIPTNANPLPTPLAAQESYCGIWCLHTKTSHSNE